MITHRQIRDAIKATIESVPGIGKIHKHERYAKRHQELAQYYTLNGDICGWFMTLRGRRETLSGDGYCAEITHHWRLRHFRSFKDEAASELIFDDTVEAVIAALRGDSPLRQLVLSINVDGGNGLQLDDAGPVMFAGHLCHAASLSLRTLTQADLSQVESARIDRIFLGRAPNIGLGHEDDYQELVYENQ